MNHSERTAFDAVDIFVKIVDIKKRNGTSGAVQMYEFDGRSAFLGVFVTKPSPAEKGDPDYKFIEPEMNHLIKRCRRFSEKDDDE